MHILGTILWKLCVGTCLLEPNVAAPHKGDFPGNVNLMLHEKCLNISYILQDPTR